MLSQTPISLLPKVQKAQFIASLRVEASKPLFLEVKMLTNSLMVFQTLSQASTLNAPLAPSPTLKTS
jgi:hypothetical protein